MRPHPRALRWQGGYRVKEIKLDGEVIKSANKITLENVSAIHKLEITFEKDLSIYSGGKVNDDGTEFRFIDVFDDDWYFENVYTAYYANLYKGTSENEFGPKKPLTRGMIVTVFYRYAKAEETMKAAFIDVDKNMYYSEPIAWANKNKIVIGIDDSHYAPERNISRQDLATIIYRYVKFVLGDKMQETDTEIEGFKDVDEIADYALVPIKWAIGNGIIKGNDQGMIRPTGNATRAEAVAMTLRTISYLKSFSK